MYLFQCESESVSKTKSYPFEKKSIRFRFDFIRQETEKESLKIEKIKKGKNWMREKWVGFGRNDPTSFIDKVFY